MRANLGRTLQMMGISVALVAIATGCAGTMPQEVIDVNTALGEAKDACATVYSPDSLDAVQGRVDSMNELADAEKYRKARKAAEPILPDVETLKSDAAKNREAAKTDASDALAKAKAALDSADKAEAKTYVAPAYNQAVAKLDEATTLYADPCKYNQAKAAAEEAARLAGNAAQAAVAEKKRAEEEAARRAEEERRRKEEEARRLEEERMRQHPPTYTVVSGDSLWRITGREQIYDNPIYWPIIYDANGDKIQNPDLIYPGQTFSIPRGMSNEEMRSQLVKMWRKLAEPSEEE